MILENILSDKWEETFKILKNIFKDNHEKISHCGDEFPIVVN